MSLCTSFYNGVDISLYFIVWPFSEIETSRVGL